MLSSKMRNRFVNELRFNYIGKLAQYWTSDPQRRRKPSRTIRACQLTGNHWALIFEKWDRVNRVIAALPFEQRIWFKQMLGYRPLFGWIITNEGFLTLRSQLNDLSWQFCLLNQDGKAIIPDNLKDLRFYPVNVRKSDVSCP